MIAHTCFWAELKLGGVTQNFVSPEAETEFSSTGNFLF